MGRNDQGREVATRRITLPSDLSDKTLHEAELRFGVEGNYDITMIIVPPFDAIYRAEDPAYVVWEKDFPYVGKKDVANEIFVEYLSYLMPELYNVERSWGVATLRWVTPGANDSTLGEGVIKLKDYTVRVINGEISIDKLWDQLYTPDNCAKIEALTRGPYVERDMIVRTLMENLPASFAHGKL